MTTPAPKQTAAAFAELERLGDITELASDSVHAAAAGAYVSALELRRSALLVAPTWAEIEAVTTHVRTELKARGRLGTEELEFRVFDSLSWTDAQKRDPRQFRAGLVLRFHQAKGGFARNESVEIVGFSDGLLRLRRVDGSEKTFPLERASKPGQGGAWFDVGEGKGLKVSPGDKLLLQANRSKEFVNGELVEVKSVQGGSIVLTDNRVIPPDYNTFTHGYAVTSHAAQGKTVDAVFVVASARSMPAVHRQQFYVSISRGRDECRVFTDDKDLLRAHVTDSSARLAAIEAIAKTPKRGLFALARNIAHRLALTARRFQEMVLAGQAIQFLPLHLSPTRRRRFPRI